jgi:hypothetical protein
MAKAQAGTVLKRWVALDEALAHGLHVPTFARQRRVSTRTVRRDLAAFRALGLELPRPRKGPDGKYRWFTAAPLLARTYCAYLQGRLGGDVTVAELERQLWPVGLLLGELEAGGRDLGSELRELFDLFRQLRERGATLRWLTAALFNPFAYGPDDSERWPDEGPPKEPAHALGEALWKGLHLDRE